MLIYERRTRPPSWPEWYGKGRDWWVAPFAALEYGMEWLAYALSNWRFLEVLEYLSRFGVLVAVIFYFSETGDRLKQKHYQAWQVINSAEGKGGNGGRIEAVEELNADGVSLVGVNLSSAFLMGVQLPKAKLARANLDGADARAADLTGAAITDASLRSANLRGAKLEGVSFAGSALGDVDLNGADLKNVDLSGASLENADLQNSNWEGARWNTIQTLKGANIFGVKNAPSGFVDWALAHGAVSRNSEGR
jgi:Pentapeptide repeats (8 copies)